VFLLTSLAGRLMLEIPESRLGVLDTGARDYIMAALVAFSCIPAKRLAAQTGSSG